MAWGIFDTPISAKSEFGLVVDVLADVLSAFNIGFRYRASGGRGAAFTGIPSLTHAVYLLAVMDLGLNFPVSILLILFGVHLRSHAAHIVRRSKDDRRCVNEDLVMAAGVARLDTVLQDSLRSNDSG